MCVASCATVCKYAYCIESPSLPSHQYTMKFYFYNLSQERFCKAVVVLLNKLSK